MFCIKVVILFLGCDLFVKDNLLVFLEFKFVLLVGLFFVVFVEYFSDFSWFLVILKYFKKKMYMLVNFNYLERVNRYCNSDIDYE